MRVLSWISGSALLASIACHVVVLLGYQVDPAVSVTLTIGIFVVWFPAVIAALPADRQRRDAGSRQVWKYLLAGAPMWMAVVAFAAMGYAVVNWILATGMLTGSISDKDPAFPRVMSGHAIAFYAAGMAMLYAAANRADPPRCFNGHRLATGQQRCDVCGAEIIQDLKVTSRSGS